jgi:hypothetical protein
MPIRRADDTLYTLGLNLSASGNPVAIKGGEYTVIMDSSGGTGTMSLQMQSPSGVWIDVQMYGAAMRTTTTSMVQAGLVLPSGLVRAAVYGGTILNLNAFLVGAG